MRASRAALPFLCLVVATGPAPAHELWIELDEHRVEAGSTVRVGLQLGERFSGEAIPRDAARIERFFVVGPQGEKPIAGIDGTVPAGIFRADAPGVHAIGYWSKPTRIELQADEFEAYLQEKGLDTILARRKAGKDSHRPDREIYTRCAKSLLVAGDGRTPAVDPGLGLPFELVVRSDWTTLAKKNVVLLALYRGSPVGGVKVSAIHRDRPDETIAARTNASGEVVLELPRQGVWLVEAVHMAGAAAGSDAEWESLWASLTFRRAAALFEGPTSNDYCTISPAEAAVRAFEVRTSKCPTPPSSWIRSRRTFTREVRSREFRAL